MALPVGDRLKYWGIAAAVFFVVLWFLDDVILPFVLGAAIAYFLDPIADRIEAAGLSRGMATGIITLLGILSFVVLALLVIPTLVSQTTGLIQTAPELAANLQAFLTDRFPELGDANSTIRRSFASIAETIQSHGGELLNTVLASFSGFFNVILLFIIAPVVSVYLLYDWDRIVARVDALLPRDHAPTIRSLVAEIDRTMAGFLRGQG
ncbi:MAG: AI-2E family transporter, partial [Boseongicola sp.]